MHSPQKNNTFLNVFYPKMCIFPLCIFTAENCITKSEEMRNLKGDCALVVTSPPGGADQVSSYWNLQRQNSSSMPGNVIQVTNRWISSPFDFKSLRGPCKETIMELNGRGIT